MKKIKKQKQLSIVMKTFCLVHFSASFLYSSTSHEQLQLKLQMVQAWNMQCPRFQLAIKTSEVSLWATCQQAAIPPSLFFSLKKKYVCKKCRFVCVNWERLWSFRKTEIKVKLEKLTFLSFSSCWAFVLFSPQPSLWAYGFCLVLARPSRMHLSISVRTAYVLEASAYQDDKRESD